MAHRLSKQGAANRIMRWGAVTAAALAACAGLFWIVAVLLLTRQTGQLLILMSGMGIGAACGAFRARKRGGRMLLVIALTVVLGFMALVDILEPEILSFRLMPEYPPTNLS